VEKTSVYDRFSPVGVLTTTIMTIYGCQEDVKALIVPQIESCCGARKVFFFFELRPTPNGS